MERKIQTSWFEQFQISLLVLICSSIYPGDGFCNGILQIAAIVFAILAGIKFIKTDFKTAMIPLIAFGASIVFIFVSLCLGLYLLAEPFAIYGLASTLITLNVLMTLSVIAAFVLSFIFIGKNLTWQKPINKVLFILSLGFIALLYTGVQNSIAVNMIAVAGTVFALLNISKLHDALDDAGKNAAKTLKIGIIIGIAATGLGVIIGWVLVVGDIMTGLALIATYVFLLLGFNKLKSSSLLDDNGKQGATFTFISAIVMASSALFRIIPIIDVVEPFLATAGLVLFYIGWNKISASLEQKV